MASERKSGLLAICCSPENKKKIIGAVSAAGRNEEVVFVDIISRAQVMFKRFDIKRVIVESNLFSAGQINDLFKLLNFCRRKNIPVVICSGCPGDSFSPEEVNLLKRTRKNGIPEVMYFRWYKAVRMQIARIG